jgi:hypothetical protein
MYVYNSPSPIIMVGTYEWYALQTGVWFTASSVQGPWVSRRPCPPRSMRFAELADQLRHVRAHLRGHAAVGRRRLHAGYMGTIVTADGGVVVRNRYYYVPYVSATVWYPPPITYGYAANPTWTPWTGWAIGFGFGWAMGAAWARVAAGVIRARLLGRPLLILGGPLLQCRLRARSVRRSCRVGTGRLGRDHRATSITSGARRTRSPAPRAATTRGRATRGLARWAPRTTRLTGRVWAGQRAEVGTSTPATSLRFSVARPTTRTPASPRAADRRRMAMPIPASRTRLDGDR